MKPSRFIKRRFLAGLIVIFPVGATLFIGWKLFQFTASFFTPLLTKIPGFPTSDFVIACISFLVTILFILIIGIITASYFGRKLLGTAEFILSRVPVIKDIFLALKKLTEAFSPQKQGFQKVVLIEYPRAGVWMVGFITSGEKWQLVGKGSQNQSCQSVFIPTAPNPTSGWIALVPEEKIIPLPISVEMGMKMVVSVGVISPPTRIVDLNKK